MKLLREEARIVKKQNANKDKNFKPFGGTGLTIGGVLHDKTRLEHSKECTKSLKKQRDKKDSERDVCEDT